MDKWALPTILKFHQTLQPQTVVQSFWAIPGLHYVGLMSLIYHISILALVPTVLAASVWGMFWQSKRLIFKCDNSSVVSTKQVFEKKQFLQLNTTLIIL